MKKNSPILWSLGSACGVILYVLLVAWFMTNAEKGFLDPMPTLLGPFLFLLLFVLSAATVSSLVFGRPTLMYLDGNKKEAIATFLYTLLWIAAVLVIFLVFIIKSS